MAVRLGLPAASSKTTPVSISGSEKETAGLLQEPDQDKPAHDPLLNVASASSPRRVEAPNRLRHRGGGNANPGNDQPASTSEERQEGLRRKKRASAAQKRVCSVSEIAGNFKGQPRMQARLAAICKAQADTVASEFRSSKGRFRSFGAR